MEAEMHLDVERRLRTAHEPLSISVNDDIWDLYVFGVTRVQRDWWVQSQGSSLKAQGSELRRERVES